MRGFAGRTVYVFGGSLGIGLAIARRFAAEGADVVVLARRPEHLEPAVADLGRCRRTPAQRFLWRAVDVTDFGRVRAVVDELVHEVGVPDVLVNCAGRALPAYVERISVAQLEETMRLHLFGCWHTVQAVLPHMRPRGGYIVNTSSLAGLIGVFGYADYCASKFAVVGFSEVLRAELRRDGIDVSVLCPPDVDTPGFAEENRHKPPETVAASAGGRVLSPDAVAAALLAGMARRRFLIVAGREARLAHLAKRWWPGLVTWVMDRQVAAVRRRVDQRDSSAIPKRST